jgi:hypothetical protein
MACSQTIKNAALSGSDETSLRTQREIHTGEGHPSMPIMRNGVFILRKMALRVSRQERAIKPPDYDQRRLNLGIETILKSLRHFDEDIEMSKKF